MKLLTLLVCCCFLLAFAEDNKVTEKEDAIAGILTEILQAFPPQKLKIRTFKKQFIRRGDHDWHRLLVSFNKVINLPLSGNSIQQVSATKVENRNSYRVAVAFKKGAFSATDGDLNYDEGRKIANGLGVEITFDSIECEFELQIRQGTDWRSKERFPNGEIVLENRKVLFSSNLKATFSGNSENAFQDAFNKRTIGEVIAESLLNDAIGKFFKANLRDRNDLDVALTDKLMKFFA